MSLKFAQAAVVAVALLMGACSTTGFQNFVTQLQGDISVVGPEIAILTKQACGFVPTIDTIAGIISANNPIVVTVNDVAQKICSAVVSSTSGARVSSPKVGAVAVHGSFKDGTKI